MKSVDVSSAILNQMVCNAFKNWEHIIQNCQITLLDDSNVCHFEFKMADIWAQNRKLPLLGTITMQYKIKAPETLAVRDS